uniref:protein-tyrosine-phosphatase n=1 Tax=Heterorhabditis bacteriophora TaxID=37862 RepID=A0A1I7WV65_HETBA
MDGEVRNLSVRRVPPYFSYKLEKTYRVGAGGSVNLTCVAVGFPMPRVFWKKSDDVMLDDAITAPIGKNVLTLSNVEQTENFTCVAVSKLGNIEATTTVEVKGKHSINKIYCMIFKIDSLSTLVTVATKHGIPAQPPSLVAKPLDSHSMQLTWGKPMFSLPIIGESLQSGSTVGQGSGRVQRAYYCNNAPIYLTWNPPDVNLRNGNIAQYRISYRVVNSENSSTEEDKKYEYENESGTSSATPMNWQNIVVSSNMSSANLTGLLSYTVYEVSIAAATDRGFGPSSVTIRKRTKENAVDEENPPGEKTLCSECLLRGKRN